MTPDPKQIVVHVVLKHFKSVTLSELKSRKRPDRITLPRNMAMLVMRKIGMTSIEIGRFFNRNHATVFYAEKSAQDRAATEPKTKAIIEAIMGELTGNLI